MVSQITNHSNRKKFKMAGPQLAFSDQLHSKKYRGDSGESFREAMNRIASALSDGEYHYKAFRDIILGQRFLPPGRVQASAGTTKYTTMHNCFVSGTIEDSLTEGGGSIMNRSTQAAKTMQMGGGIGYDFSTLRPRWALIRKLQSQSSGPVSFMEIYDAVCRTIASSGHRRGAQMGVLRIDHPDIEEFIHAKQNETFLTGFNVSVAVTDHFMNCVEANEPFPLTFNGEVYKEINARMLWETIMRSTWDWAEPGVLFIDTINKMNNLYYCETITATNPCGEQPLPPYGACLLGSFNLVKYLKQKLSGVNNSGYVFDWEQFENDIPIVVRAMDNVIDLSVYPLYEQEKEAKAKRRMGLGITGLANCLEALSYSYGSLGFIAMQDEILKTLNMCAYKASSDLAREKGSFQLFDREKYGQGQFIQTLPESIQSLIADQGIRNSHLTSIAPTGTISLCADNVSSGIEPVFAYEFDRTITEFGGKRIETVQDYGVRVLGVKGKTSDQVTAAEHLAVLTTASKNVDSAVSKTCNVPHDISWNDFKEIYMQAWLSGCKGCTTFRVNAKRGGILNVKDDDTSPNEETSMCYVDAVTGRKECE